MEDGADAGGAEEGGHAAHAAAAGRAGEYVQAEAVAHELGPGVARARRVGAEGVDVSDEDVPRLSPARHEHINPFGKYRFDRLPRKGRFWP